MRDNALTNNCFILEDFEIKLCSNEEKGDERQILAAAPTTEGWVAYYIITNGDDVPVAVQSQQGVQFGEDGFGAGFTVDWLESPEMAWLNAEAINDAISSLPYGSYENLREFADAVEGRREQ